VIASLKDLERLLKLCRKQGVTELTIGEVSLKLGDLPVEASGNSHLPTEDHLMTDPYAGFPQGDLTPEQLMFYSAGGIPSEDPELKKGDV
jgi:hypothetical protein